MNTEKEKIRISKTLSYLLRHGALEEKLSIDSEGYVPINEILSRKEFKKLTIEDIKTLVENNDKKRFKLKFENDIYYIKANQGSNYFL
jgi:2'-phosphotransferase